MLSIVMNFIRRHRLIIQYVAVLLLYAGITLVSVLRHEPVPDEANYWIMARDAKSISELYRLIPWAAHPILWNLVLFFLSHAGLSIVSAALLNWAIMVVAVTLFLCKAPFSRFFRCSFIFSFYIFFEYVVFARNYGITILLLFLTAYQYPQRFVSPLRYGILIFLLFSSHYLVFPLASILTALYIFELVVERYIKKDRVFASVIMAAGGLFTFFSAFSVMDVLHGLFLPKDHWSYARNPIGDLQVAVSALNGAFVPVGDDFSRFFGCLFGSVVIGLIALSLARKPRILFAFLLSIFTFLFLFVYVSPLSSNRHFALIQMVSIFFLWISFFHEEKDHSWKNLQWAHGMRTIKFRKIVFGLIIFAFVFSCKSAIRGHWFEWRYELSGGRSTARMIKNILAQEGEAKDMVVAFPVTSVLPLVAELPSRTVWSADLQKIATFFKGSLTDLQGEEITEMEVVTRMKDKFGDLSRTLLVLDRPLPFEEALGYRFFLLHAVIAEQYGYMGNYMAFLYKPLPLIGQ